MTVLSAYDLILKNKERLLSFDEPTRFIFSHSALSEGWDNPNVFQICTLRHTQSGIRKRQEVGRGLRICVDEMGNRMDYEHLGDTVHEINKLTVIANENYEQFVDALQKETKEALRERPTKATAEYFAQFTVTVDGEKHQITTQEAASIVAYLYDNDYVDEEENITQEYRQALADGTLEPVSKKLGHGQLLINGFNHIPNEFLAVVMNSVNVSAIDFVPQCLKLFFACIIIQLTVLYLCRLIAIFNHTSKN